MATQLNGKAGVSKTPVAGSTPAVASLPTGQEEE